MKNEVKEVKEVQEAEEPLEEPTTLQAANVGAPTFLLKRTIPVAAGLTRRRKDANKRAEAGERHRFSGIKPLLHGKGSMTSP